MDLKKIGTDKEALDQYEIDHMFHSWSFQPGAAPKRVVSAKGPEHDRVFFVELRLGGHALGRGEGKNKKEAEQLAARSALAKLGLLRNGTGSGRSSKRRRGGRRRPRRRKKKEKAP